MSDRAAAARRRVAFCPTDELAAKGWIKRWVEDLRDEIAAIQTSDGVQVVSTICPHFGGEFDLSRSRTELRCRWHGWRFDGKTGRCLTHPVKTKLRHYRFDIDGGTLFIECP